MAGTIWQVAWSNYLRNVMTPSTDQFRAFGDPVRMEMILRLSAGEALTVGALSDGLPVTRQGARKHIQVLVDSRVVALRQEGRTVKATLNKDTVLSMRDWMSNLERRWDFRLDRLRQFAEKK